MYPGIHRLGRKAVAKQYLTHKAVFHQTFAVKGKPARRRRTGPF
jgi:hypothetical protein